MQQFMNLHLSTHDANMCEYLSTVSAKFEKEHSVIEKFGHSSALPENGGYHH